MPYIGNKMKKECKEQGFEEFVQYLTTVPVALRKGFVAWATMYMAKHCFTANYFGKSTGTDAVRSAFIELEKGLAKYEAKKKRLNGGV